MLADDPQQKIIIFTEFVATQQYIRTLLDKRGYSVTILNGGMDMDERDAALKEFRNSSSVFISTDAGGEGLNLQFANIIINYDLPWNPMKIEQRCGRVDRIGQQRDVHIYNFIVGDTVENRVREVLEIKLSVILEELGVDKYSDVLDSEAAECDFTHVYMDSIGNPRDVENNVFSVTRDMRQQVKYVKEYKDIIHEDKDLTELVGTESDFDVDSALRQMVTYYNLWQGKATGLLDRISIADRDIVKHLKADIIQDRKDSLLSVAIEDFPNENGYFMLWELSVSNDEEGRRILPIFINDDNVLRPVAGARLMDVFLDGTSMLHTSMVSAISEDKYEILVAKSREFAYNKFVELKNKQLKRNEETYKKYIYALKLRLEAAEHIGIENIRLSRLRKLAKERIAIEDRYKKGSQIFPDFKLMLLIKLEA